MDSIWKWPVRMQEQDEGNDGDDFRSMEAARCTHPALQGKKLPPLACVLQPLLQVVVDAEEVVVLAPQAVLAQPDEVVVCRHRGRQGLLASASCR